MDFEKMHRKGRQVTYAQSPSELQNEKKAIN